MTAKVDQILKTARHQAASARSWADVSNLLFDSEDGLVSRAFPTRTERERFVKTAAYRELMNLIDDVRQRTGFIAGATPTKSGKFVVRLPKSLHAALETEAAREGVSLNQLVVAKLAVQMSHLVAGQAS
ncbi:MAG: type II toxin-antitoxin system HicB family antitoxin [Gemmataceae bacterium]|nr:type II toxin-antitoxin system HicB family antitoxin [Gemmataceae bacterium]